jgi:hypothetical protein
MSRIAKIFDTDWGGFNLRRGVSITVVMVVPLVVLELLHRQEYWLSVSFGALFVGLCDPGGRYADRVSALAAVGAVGAALTALGFGIGGGAWGWVAAAGFVVTVLGGLTVKFGLNRFAAATLLNVWFVIVLAVPLAYRLDRLEVHVWAQTLAWLTGSALTVGYVCLRWLISGKAARPRPTPDVLPGDTTPIALTRPVVLFVVVRAVAVSAAIAIAFRLRLPNADWMPLATIVALKPSLRQSALVAQQRIAGTVIGAAIAVIFLVSVANRAALEVVVVLLGTLAGSLRTVSYTLFTTAVAAAVLIALDLPHPTDLTYEGRRLLFTLAGVGIAVLVMFLTYLPRLRQEPAD